MRKMIVMALAGYLWRKFQSRAFRQAQSGRAVRRY